MARTRTWRRISFATSRLRLRSRSSPHRAWTSSSPLGWKLIRDVPSRFLDKIGKMIPRSLTLPRSKSFFLFGPRGTGKSTWLRAMYPEAPVLDLLEADYQEFLRKPSRLEAWADAHARSRQPFVIDEVQRLPELLN